MTKISLTDILKNVMSFLERSGTEYMNWLNKLERKFGNWAIPNLIVWLIGAYTIGFVLYRVNPSIIGLLMLSPYHILHGQIWRLITWVFMPTDTNLVYLLIMALFYYQLGTTLERTWGTYRYNVYIFSGILFTVVGSFLCMGVVYLMYGSLPTEIASAYFYSGSYAFSTYYINLSIFLAFAATYPDMQVLLMFVIPVKVKWMGILDAVLMLYYVIKGGVFTRFAIIASLLNFVLYFYRMHRSRISPKQMHRKAQFEKKSNAGRAKVTRHKCAICGRTEEDDPSLEFRFCSKCNGNYEYCQYHLFTHEHVK